MTVICVRGNNFGGSWPTVSDVTSVASFLTPPGFAAPTLGAMLREASVLGELAWSLVDPPRRDRTATRREGPVVLVPGFLAGDGTLGMLGSALRAEGFRTYRSLIRANVGCTQAAVAQLEQRLEAVAIRRDSRVQVVGHSLGGMLARRVAVRRPDLVAGIVTLGSPVLAPGAHHVSLAASVRVLTRLTAAGVPGLMAEDCVAGECARSSFEESQEPLSDDVAFTAIYSKRDGVVDWQACVDPGAHPVEVTASHVGMAVDTKVRGEVIAALRRGTA